MKYSVLSGLWKDRGHAGRTVSNNHAEKVESDLQWTIAVIDRVKWRDIDGWIGHNKMKNILTVVVY